jgi:diguanylate cyclase (GGDEF)-like protein
MAMWVRVGWTALAWGAVVGAHALAGTAAPAGVVIGLVAVAATGLVWGGVGGLLAGLLFGIGRNALGEAGSAHDGIVLLVREGALFAPVAFGLLGFAIGSIVTLRHQLRLQRQASERAQYDALTGLLTRGAFERRLAAWMASADRRLARRDRRAPQGATSPAFALLFVDLDRFKVVNDTFGHDSGDAVLKRFAATLRESVRDGDLVARLGGDEFAVALHGVDDQREAALIAKKVVAAIATPFDVAGRAVSVTASIGAAMYPGDGHDLAALVAHADKAMYTVKAAGKPSYDFSSPEMREARSRRHALERALRFALHDNEFEVAYQPQIDLSTGRALVGFEALLRWNSRELGTVSPTECIPIAEETGAIVPIGHWLLREACFQIKAWQVMGHPGLKMSVNVSAVQFRQPDFVDQIVQAIVDARIRPSLLEIEITESVLVNQYDLALQTLRRLDELGVRTALDDFGTGYSSGAWLQRLPIGSLKIDRSVVSGLTLSAAGHAGVSVPIIEGMSALGQHLGKIVVAEGVETEHQASFLTHVGVARAQGYLFARPMKPGAAETTLRRLLEPAADRREAGSGPEAIGKVVAVLRDPAPSGPASLLG